MARHPPNGDRTVAYDTTYAMEDTDEPPNAKANWNQFTDLVAYPETLEERVFGTGMVTFVVSPTGEPTNIETTCPVHPLLDKTAVRGVSALRYT